MNVYILQISINFPQMSSHLKRIISTNCCIHTVVPPDDGPRYARNMYRLTKYTKNKLCSKLVVFTRSDVTLNRFHMFVCSVSVCVSAACYIISTSFS